ncbi:hypothetical protein An12g10310 [Aspergillus niger]|uniref:Uncharacterized protein n=2 Tax=Aspergillus niger TaxID=5061 RepID=A2R0Y8_ASPNC|nr:hypothetical protein An12g10310 [Aspergillus niger]CAL00931.1 hypothetical protein An12g10310 [Aspergillus niger]
MAASSPELLIVKPYGTSLGAINGETGTEQGFYIQVLVRETSSIAVWPRQRKFKQELPRSPSRITVDSSDFKYIADSCLIMLRVPEGRCRWNLRCWVRRRSNSGSLKTIGDQLILVDEDPLLGDSCLATISGKLDLRMEKE